MSLESGDCGVVVDVPDGDVDVVRDWIARTCQAVCWMRWDAADRVWELGAAIINPATVEEVEGRLECEVLQDTRVRWRLAVRYGAELAEWWWLPDPYQVQRGQLASMFGAFGHAAGRELKTEDLLAMQGGEVLSHLGGSGDIMLALLTYVGGDCGAPTPIHG